MSDCPGQTIDNCLLIFMHMAVMMGNAMGMHIGMFFVVVMVVSMAMFAHVLPPLTVLPIIPHFDGNCKPREGIIIFRKM